MLSLSCTAAAAATNGVHAEPLPAARCSRCQLRHCTLRLTRGNLPTWKPQQQQTPHQHPWALLPLLLVLVLLVVAS
jgi:hypothetical protein